MSRLYNTYLSLKKINSQTIYLFKSGIFLIAIDKDANILSDIFKFKLSNLTNTIAKCGFPVSSFDKYSKLFKLYNLDVKVIDCKMKTSYKLNEYRQNQDIIKIIELINSIDIDNLSVLEAYKFIETLKNKALNLNI